MARLFTDGAEAGDVLFWTGGTAGSAAISSAQARSGNYSYLFTDAGAQTSTATVNLASALSSGYLRFGFYLTAGATGENTFLRFRSTSTVLASLRYEATSSVFRAYRGDAANLLATATLGALAGSWIRVEVYYSVSDTVGAFDVRIDGVSALTFSGDTKPGTETTFNNVQFTAPASIGIFYLDDLALNDTTGGSDNSWCGDGRIVALIPDGDGDASAWTPSAGSNYQCVDDVPPDGDTSYVEASLSGTQDLYTVSAFDGTDKTILRAWAECRARGTVGGEQITLTVKTGGNEYQSAARSLTASYARYVGTDYPTNPATSAAWTDGELDAVQVGQEVV